MLEPTFSILNPDDNSPEFYKSFYSFYSLLQINDIIMNELLNGLDSDSQKELIDCIVRDGFDMQHAYVFTIGAGLSNPSLEKRKKENRGLDLSVFSDLKNQGINSLEWYLQANEFMNLYAICEQGIKDYLILQQIDPATLKESKIIIKLFENLRNKNKKEQFLNEMKDSSAEIFEKENEIRSVWKYFTEIRNLYMHAGGRITERYINRMNNLKVKIGHELEDIEYKHSLNLELLTFDIEEFFEFNFKNKMIYSIETRKMNFFRNFIIILIESLYKVEMV